MQDNANSVRNLVIGMLLVAAPFGLAYALTRGNPGSEVLLIVAVFCAGLALAFALASGVQRVGAIALRLSGRSSRDIMIVGLSALSLLTPWTIDIAAGPLPRVWLAAAILAVVFVGVAAVNDSEFAYWAHYDTTPPDRGRLDVILAAAALALVLLGSWFDTGRTLRRRAIMGDWLARVTSRSRS